jgi:hypothetical protein
MRSYPIIYSSSAEPFAFLTKNNSSIQDHQQFQYYIMRHFSEEGSLPRPPRSRDSGSQRSSRYGEPSKICPEDDGFFERLRDAGSAGAGSQTERRQDRRESYHVRGPRLTNQLITQVMDLGMCPDPNHSFSLSHSF